ncbi:Sec-independent protein translocase protein TatB [Campylobacter majalis]|uniref:Sec-independent protein translocase protein TatB homolog n=1 Tax=Campylobacter majalis TaxID=2790656 RepID=A0ABN7K2M2_9BACT|nr:Sec-independent protein translocase protein TatB [Campylobacter majalis]CAD7286798.1 Sec-independent protein translocase protein TatB [Campylobacter majalis]
MFGMSLPEIITIAVIAVIVLGPEKLPETMINIAKMFKAVKKSVNDAKASFDQEMKIAELKEDARKYKENLTKTTENVRKKLTFEELDELKKGVNDVKSSVSDSMDSIKKGIDSVKNPTKAIKDAVLDNDKKEA